MRLKVAELPLNDDIEKALYLKEGDEDNTVVVTDGEWNYITFQVRDNKLVFSRNGYIDDISVSIVNGGKLEEVEEE